MQPSMIWVFTWVVHIPRHACSAVTYIDWLSCLYKPYTRQCQLADAESSAPVHATATVILSASKMPGHMISAVNCLILRCAGEAAVVAGHVSSELASLVRNMAKLPAAAFHGVRVSCV